MKKHLRNKHRLKTAGACLGVIMGGAAMALAQDSSMMDKLMKENQELKTRMDALESLAQKEGLLPSGTPAKPVSAMSDVIISGYVQASYFYNTTSPADKQSDGYLWNTTPNSFSLNKVKLTLASPAVKPSGEKWDAGYRVSMIWGEDSPVLNTGSPLAGFEALREAYVELNVPIGTGLDVKAGQLISLLNWESGDGGAANPNFSQGYQWFYTGNGPAAGVQLGYAFTDWLDVKVRLQNGIYAGPIDNNNGKTIVTSVGIKPVKDAWVNLIGFGGDETATTELWGGSVLAGYQFTPKLGSGFEFDYFNYNPDIGPAADLWSVGGWLWYDFTSKVGVAVRADYLQDKNGNHINGIGLPGATRAAATILSPDSHGDLGSLTLTLNLKPTPNIKIQPEIRYDYTSYSGGLDGRKDRVIFGMGVSYLF